MAPWIGILLTALFALTGFAVIWGKLNQRMDNHDAVMNNFRQDHMKHFETTQHLDVTQATIDQTLKGHVDLDSQQFAQILDTLKEMRADIKELVKIAAK